MSVSVLRFAGSGCYSMSCATKCKAVEGGGWHETGVRSKLQCHVLAAYMADETAGLQGHRKRTEPHLAALLGASAAKS